MLYDTTAQNCYSFEESRNLSCERECRSFPSGWHCKTVRGIYQGDFGALSLIRFLQVLSLRHLPPIEMTLRGRGHFTENVFPVCFPIPLLVISSGGRMLHDAIVKNRYSFEESRNLSCERECRFFPSGWRCKTVRGIYQGDFEILSHTILTGTVTAALTTARNDVKRKGCGKVAGWIDGTGWDSLLRRFCPCGSDPSPRPLASPPSLRGHSLTVLSYKRDNQ